MIICLYLLHSPRRRTCGRNGHHLKHRPLTSPQRHTVNGHGKSLRRFCRPQQKHRVVVHGGFRVDGAAPQRADVELRQKILQQHAQLRDPHVPTRLHVGSQLGQLPSNALPQHGHTNDGGGRSLQRSRRFRQRHAVAGHGGFQADCSGRELKNLSCSMKAQQAAAAGAAAALAGDSFDFTAQQQAAVSGVAAQTAGVASGMTTQQQIDASSATASTAAARAGMTQQQQVVAAGAAAGAAAATSGLSTAEQAAQAGTAAGSTASGFNFTAAEQAVVAGAAAAARGSLTGMTRAQQSADAATAASTAGAAAGMTPTQQASAGAAAAGAAAALYSQVNGEAPAQQAAEQNELSL